MADNFQVFNSEYRRNNNVQYGYTVSHGNSHGEIVLDKNFHVIGAAAVHSSKNGKSSHSDQTLYYIPGEKYLLQKKSQLDSQADHKPVLHVEGQRTVVLLGFHVEQDKNQLTYSVKAQVQHVNTKEELMVNILDLKALK